MAAGVLAVAQEPTYSAKENPYQAEFGYQVNEELAPQVNINGLLWHSVRVEPKDPQSLPEDDDVPTTVHLELENSSEDAVRATVVLLLEDEFGNALDRIECKSVRLGRNDAKTFKQKFKISGRTLQLTRKLYLFCELE
jgi:hypothetical protein